MYSQVKTNMIVKVKICGIRTLESAQTAIDAGADFLGFNFVPISKRFISPLLAKKIITKLYGTFKTVGVFQDANLEYVNNITTDLKLDFVQLHGNEDAFFIRNIKAPIIKTIRSSQEIPADYKPPFLLLDRLVQGMGKMVNKKDAQKIARNFSLFLAGGLTVENVEKNIKNIMPYAVDVANGIETNGIPDKQKIINFIRKSKGVTI